MQQYQGFGFQFNSTWSLPMAKSSSKKPVDVTIEQGECPLQLDCHEDFNAYLQANNGEIMLNIPGIARFYCTKNRICVEPESEDPCDVQTFLAYAAIPYWLLLQDCLVLRGTSLSFDGESAVLLLSHTGGGSSTLGLLASKQSAKLLSDHLCVLKKDKQGNVKVYPGYIKLKLWKETMDNFKVSKSCCEKLRKNTYLYAYSTPAIKRALPVTQVMMLSSSNKIEKDEAVKGIKKLDTYLNYSYFLSNHKEVRDSRHVRELWLPIAKSAQMQKLYLCHGVDTPSSTVERVMAIVESEKVEA